MLQSSFLPTILATLHAAYTYHQDPRPANKAPSLIGPSETALYSILSRIALTDAKLFVEAISAAAGANTDTIVWLTSEWLSNFDSIGDPAAKKLHALALTNLLSSPSSPHPAVFMLEQLQSLLTMWTDVVIELGTESLEESQGDYLWHGRPSDEHPAWTDETPEEARHGAMSRVDPVYSVNIRDFVSARLTTAIDAVGADVFQQQWLSRCDAAVVNAFAALGLL